MRGLLMVTLVTLLVGCGGSAGEDDPGTTTTPPTVPAAATAAATTPAATATSTAVAQAASPSPTRQAPTPTDPPQPSPTATEIVPTPVVVGIPANDLPIASQVSAAIPVGVSPQAVAVGHGAIWVYNDMDGILSRIDPATNAVVVTIPIATPLDLTRLPSDLLGERLANPDLAIDGTSVWAIKPEEQAVVRVDPQMNTIIATVPLEARAVSIAVDGASLWASHWESSSITRIDTATGAVVATIVAVPTPAGIAVYQDAV
jgi:hypothetical protein